MTHSRFIRIWAICSLFWMMGIPYLVSDHYEQIRQPSTFVYNAFDTPWKLVKANAETRKQLIRSFPGTWYNMFSFGIPGKVVIEYPLQFDANRVASTWMPGPRSIMSVTAESIQWQAFQSRLIAEGSKLREHEIRELLHQYLLPDILKMIGAPLLVLVGWMVPRIFRRRALAVR